MDRIAARILKPIAFAALTFGASYYLFHSAFISLILSLVPLLLGWLGVFEAFSYTIAAALFIAAIVWCVVPVDMKNLVELQTQAAVKEFTAAMPTPTKPD